MLDLLYTIWIFSMVCFFFGVVYFLGVLLIPVWLSWQMSSTPQFHIGYANGANRCSRNVASAAWVIFNPSNEFLDVRGIFLSRATNNLVEYEAVITLMTNASTLGIRSLVVRLDSELIVSQLTLCYSIFHPTLYQKYLRVRFLERSFNFISYEHIPRTLNSFVDSLANEILDWHLTR